MNIQEFIKSLESKLTHDIDLSYHVDINSIDQNDAYNSIYEMLDKAGAFNIEIIYYSRAMDYLMNHDCSLNESLNIAAEIGYEVQNLNSEILASLLASTNARNEFVDLEDEINDYFNRLTDEA